MTAAVFDPAACVSPDKAEGRRAGSMEAWGGCGMDLFEKGAMDNSYTVNVIRGLAHVINFGIGV